MNISKATGPHADEACNIHQVSVGNLDSTCHVEVDTSKKSSRHFDFNSGALALELTEGGQAELQTPLEALDLQIRLKCKETL